MAHPTSPRKKTAARTTAAKTVADYLRAAPKDKRPALLKLCATIRAAAPKATERLSYGLVGFVHDGVPLVYLGYWKDHFSLYGNFDPNDALLKSVEQSGKGTLRFPADRPIPFPLVTKIVKARVADIESRRR